jgi:hypothetical protein
MVPVVAAQSSDSGTSVGDVNGDGVVNILDVQAAISQALGVSVQTPEADADASNSVDVGDVTHLVNTVLNTGGLVQRVKVEKTGYHHLHLRLLGASITYDGGLDGQRRIGYYGESMLRSGHHGDTANMAKLERTLGIDGIEDILNGYDLRLVLSDQFRKPVVHFLEADFQGFARVEPNGPGGKAGKSSSFTLNYSKAGVFPAAIYS